MKLLKPCSLLLGAAVMFAIGLPTESSANVNVSVGISVPAPVYIPAPPAVVVIPNTYVYYVPDIEPEILFYGGFWYRPHQGYWFRSRSYNGPWRYLPPHRVPHALVVLPPGYRDYPPRHYRIPHGQLKKNWSRWERERFWYQRGWRDEDYSRGPVRPLGGRDGNGRGFDDRRPGGHGHGR